MSSARWLPRKTVMIKTTKKSKPLMVSTAPPTAIQLKAVSHSGST